MEEAINDILSSIKIEVGAQNASWGQQNHNPVEWMAILSEEVGEAAKEAVDYHFNYPAKSTWKGSAEELQFHRLKEFRKELIQVAAIAVQMVASLDRNELKNRG